MDKITYLKLALAAKCYKKKAWLVSVFSLIQEGPEEYKNSIYPYRIVQNKTNFSFVDPTNNNQLTTIDNATPNEPLFKFKDKILIDNSFCANVSEPLETTYGNLLFNLISLVNCFGTKIPYINGKITVSAVEDIIVKTLTSTPTNLADKRTDVIYIDEYIKFVDSLAFIEGLSLLCVWTVSETMLTSAPGFAEYKQSLINEYGNSLTDPVKLAEYEKKLQIYDENYIKDDPANNVFIGGKVKNMARKKMFLTIGGDAGFGDGLKITPVTNSLEQGWPSDPEQFTALMNTLRFGSYARGKETQKGGTTNKVFMRAGNNFQIIAEDCQTTLGITRKISVANTLVGKYIRINNSWLLIASEAEANQYVDKTIMVRSPMYCKHSGDRICQFCSGQRLALNPQGISTALIEVSAIVMNSSMKLMHGTVLSTKKLIISDIYS